MTEPVEPLISVIIPVYNYARLLPRALDSVLAQEAEDVELIVVNDGSRDNTQAVLAEYGTCHARLRAIHQANAGAAAARNRGIGLARGSHVLLLDADDELLPNALATLRKLVAAHPRAGVFLGAHLSEYADRSERLHLPSPVPIASPVQLARRYLLQKRISVSHGCSLFRRELLLQRPYPENLRAGEDIPVFAYLLVSAPVVITREPLARIHKHADSLRHNREREEERVATMVQEVFAALPAQCQPLRKRYAAQRYLSLFRAAVLTGEKATARRFYRSALHLSVPQALRWTYLRKAIRLFAWP